MGRIKFSKSKRLELIKKGNLKIKKKGGDDTRAGYTNEDVKKVVKVKLYTSTGSINYHLSVTGSNPTEVGNKHGQNFVSFPFYNSDRLSVDNGEDAYPRCGYWTPEEVDKWFNYSITHISSIGVNTTEGAPEATMKVGYAWWDPFVNIGPGQSGSWEGSLEKIWPHKSYIITATGSVATPASSTGIGRNSTVSASISGGLIPPNTKVRIKEGWNSFAWPFTGLNEISASGITPAGNDENVVHRYIRDGEIIQQIADFTSSANYDGYIPYEVGLGEWTCDYGSINDFMGANNHGGRGFTFKTGSGILGYYDGHQGTLFSKIFSRYASTGSNTEESNNQDTGSDNYYTGSEDVCIGSGSDYIEGPINASGNFIVGTSGGGTFQTYPSSKFYTIWLNTKFSGSHQGNVPTSSILNWDNSEVCPIADWGTESGSIAVGFYNQSGSVPWYAGQHDSGSVNDGMKCFGSTPWSSHPLSPGAGTQYASSWKSIKMYLDDFTGNWSSGSYQTLGYPTGSAGSNIEGSSTWLANPGSAQTSSIRVYSPSCGKVYMARLYQFTTSSSLASGEPAYSITDIENATDVTHKITGNAQGNGSFKVFNRHFIKLRNDVI